MVLICFNLFRSRRLFSLPAHLTRDLRVCQQAGCPLKRPHTVSCQISCQRTANRVRATPTGPPLLACSGGRWAYGLKIGPRTGSALHSAPVRTQCPVSGHRFHTSAPARALPLVYLWLVLKPLQKLMAIILGRSLRMWWGTLPANRWQLMREWVWQRRWRLAGVASVAMVIVFLFLLTHLDECPVTGRTRLLVFNRESYMELAVLTSEECMEEFAELLVPVSDPRHKAVELLVQHLQLRNKDIPEMSDISWNVHVVESPTVNAFVIPNGEIFMFTGMLDTVADIHQLTIILGHEMAHVLLAHSVEEASLSHIVDLLSLILLAAIWAVCPRDSLALLGQWVQGKLSQLMFSRPYSRKLEVEADQVGMLLAAKACADVRAGPVLWQQMEITDQLSGELNVPEWLSTHPSHRNRVTQLDRLVPQALELRESCGCPALPATDPRTIFSKSVQVLLDNAQDKGREGQEGSRKVHQTQSLASLTAALPAALLDPNAPSNVDRESKVLPVVSEAAAAAPVPAPPEGEGSQ